MSGPAFTVALAAYNEEDWVGSAIRSVLAQTREDFELVVVDDGSADGTAEVVRGFESEDPRVRLVSQQNRGLAAALNAAITAGSAPYIALIDADDLWMPGYLEGMGRALDGDDGAGFAYTDAWILEHPSGRFQRQSSNVGMGEPVPPPRDPEAFLRLLIEFNFVFGLAAMRRSALEEVGAFNESLRACEDYELWIRLLAHGYRAARAPGILAIVRDRSGSMHLDEANMLTHIREVCRITAEELPAGEEVKRLARERMRRLDGSLAALRAGRRGDRMARALRRRVGGVRHRLMAKRIWLDDAPAEVAAAFPELAKRG
jgi:glycosyltransferase involved in cell wall biosynthesis